VDGTGSGSCRTFWFCENAFGYAASTNMRVASEFLSLSLPLLFSLFVLLDDAFLVVGYF
jgi:hypothetical protein